MTTFLPQLLHSALGDELSVTMATDLPSSLKAERDGTVAILTLARAGKRNALDDDTIIGIDKFFSAIPNGVGAVVIAAEGEHFSAGLDLSELNERGVTEGV